MAGSVVVIGLGAMGGAIATRMKEEGVDITGYDISEDARHRFSDAGGRVSASLDVVKDASIVITSVPNDAIIWSLLTEDGLANRLQSHQTFVEMSTILPQTMIKVAELLQGKVRELVDAPVSGGPNEAKAGKLSLLVGAVGKELAPETKRILSLVGSIYPIGEPGSGKSLKLVNNMISMANTAVMTEAFQLGRELGLDSQTMYDVLSKSGGASTMFAKRIPYVLDDDFSARFAVYLAEKDTRLALQMASQIHFPTPLLANVHQRYEAAMAAGLENDDIVGLIKLYQKGKQT